MTRPQLGIEIIELFTLSAFVPTSEHTQLRSNASRRDAARGEKATHYLSLQNIPARVGGAVPQRPQTLKSFSPIFWNKNSPLPAPLEENVTLEASA